MQAITEDNFTNDLHNVELSLTDMVLNDSVVNRSNKPHTSLKSSRQCTGGLSQAVRPSNLSNRPITGVVSTDLLVNDRNSIEKVIRTGRAGNTSRPMSTAYDKRAKLGTASILSNYKDGEFIHVANLNLNKFSKCAQISCSLFDYLYYVTKDYKIAINLIDLVCKNISKNDCKNNQSGVYSKCNSVKKYLVANESDSLWWWYLQKARCLYKLGLLREAEKSIHESFKLHTTMESYILLALIAIRFDQPLRAIQIYEKGLTEFPNNTDLLIAKARIYERLDQLSKSTSIHKIILQLDPMNIESLASFAVYYFYEDQPEVSLQFYRRILQYGYESAELYNNLGLCSFYSQQYDVCLKYFNEAISRSDSANASDIYFNLAHIAINIADFKMAYECLRISLCNNHNHAETLNNLAVIEQKFGNLLMARKLYESSCQLAPDLFESHYNLAYLTESFGELQTSYRLVKHALNLFPNNMNLKKLHTELQSHFVSF